jgi:hypothetical protein
MLFSSEDGCQGWRGKSLGYIVLFFSEDSLVQGDINLVLDVITLYKALGGGWEPAEK